MCTSIEREHSNISTLSPLPEGMKHPKRRSRSVLCLASLTVILLAFFVSRNVFSALSNPPPTHKTYFHYVQDPHRAYTVKRGSIIWEHKKVETTPIQHELEVGGDDLTATITVVENMGVITKEPVEAHTSPTLPVLIYLIALGAQPHDPQERTCTHALATWISREVQNVTAHRVLFVVPTKQELWHHRCFVRESKNLMM